MANTHVMPRRPLGAGPPVATRTSPFAFAMMLVLLAATIPWRRKQNFTGQFDTVVLAKSALLVLAVVALFWARGRITRPLNPVPCAPLLIAGTYFLVATMGSMFFGSMIASAALALRATLVAYIVLLVLELVSPLEAITALAYAIGTLTVFTAATGTFIANGRLSGRLLAISPNEIAFTAGFTLIFLIWQAANAGRTMPWHLAAIAVMGGIALLTQSRTTTALLAVLVPLVALTGRRGQMKALAAILVAIVPVLYVVLFTDVIPRFLTRGGNLGSAKTLESRTIAWGAALRSPESLGQALLGRGSVRQNGAGGRAVLEHSASRQLVDIGIRAGRHHRVCARYRPRDFRRGPGDPQPNAAARAVVHPAGSAGRPKHHRKRTLRRQHQLRGPDGGGDRRHCGSNPCATGAYRGCTLRLGSELMAFPITMPS